MYSEEKALTDDKQFYIDYFNHIYSRPFFDVVFQSSARCKSKGFLLNELAPKIIYLVDQSKSRSFRRSSTSASDVSSVGADCGASSVEAECGASLIASTRSFASSSAMSFVFAASF